MSKSPMTTRGAERLREELQELKQAARRLEEERKAFEERKRKEREDEEGEEGGQTQP